MKHTLKQLLQTLGTLRALPHRLRYALMTRLLDRPRAFSLASERLARQPGLIGLHTRAAFYRAVTDHVGSDVHFGFMSLLSKPDVTFGDRVYIGRFCTLGRVAIGDDVMLADGVQVLSGRHQHGRTVTPGQTLRDNEQSFTKITLGRGAWIGANAVVMADVGEGAIVAAGAVVVHPVPAGARVAGVPARVMQQRASDAA